MRLLLVLGVVVAGMLIALVVMLRTTAPAPTVAPRADAAAAAPVRPDAARVVAPIAIDAATPATERAEILARLHDSGSGVEPWDDQGRALLASIAHGGVEIRDSACFIAGCGATFTFPSEAEYRRRLDELPSSELYRAWTGGKRLTDPEVRGDGHVIVSIVLYRPD